MNAAIAPEAAPVWRVYRMNDYEWWIAMSKDDVIRSYSEVQGCSVADLKSYDLLDPDQVRELTEAELDRLVFVDDDCSREDPTRKRSFRAELERVLRVERPEFPQFFATTEI
jgi:hypothetical protein